MKATELSNFERANAALFFSFIFKSALLFV
jgi:hypothetical protein